MRYFFRAPEPSNWARLLRLIGLVVGAVAVLAVIGLAINRWGLGGADEAEFLDDIAEENDAEADLAVAEEA